MIKRSRPKLSPRTRSLCAGLLVVLAATITATSANAADVYIIDDKGQHAFVQFRIKHLGYSWLYGRFTEFGGSFLLDRDSPANSSVMVEIDTGSVDTNHTMRDFHLRSGDFLSAGSHPKARFVSTAVERTGENTGVIKGNLTLNGVTKPIEIAVEEIGNGLDPWGGYRAGFLGKTSLALADFGIDYDLGRASQTVELTLSIEGVRQ
jgi:polyisoprenoid-binding protein YceI